jgi:tetratricopeptide (TPR) repeat protein
MDVTADKNSSQTLRRALAGAGLVLLVLGFLVAIGLGHLVGVLVVAVLVAGGAVGLFALVRRHDVAGRAVPRVHGLDQAGRRALAGGARAIRCRAEGVRQKAGSRRKPRSLHDPHREATRLNARGTELRRKGDPVAAIAAHEAALELAREAGDPSTEAMTLNNLALALGHAGNEQAAVVHFDEAAVLLRELEDDHHEGQVLANLGLLHGRSGRREQAVFCLETALGKLEPGSRAYRRVEEQLRRAS